MWLGEPDEKEHKSKNKTWFSASYERIYPTLNNFDMLVCKKW